MDPNEQRKALDSHRRPQRTRKDVYTAVHTVSLSHFGPSSDTVSPLANLAYLTNLVWAQRQSTFQVPSILTLLWSLLQVMFYHTEAFSAMNSKGRTSAEVKQ